MASSFDTVISDGHTSDTVAEVAAPHTFRPVARHHAGDVARRDTGWAFRRSEWCVMALCGVWLAGSLIVAVNCLVRLLRIQRIVSQCQTAPRWLQHEVEAVAGTLKVRRTPIAVSDRVATPFVWCLWTLSLVWPRGLADRDRAARIRGLLVHELAHVRRRDHWGAWLDMAARITWWWNPLGWVVRRKLRESSELACDEWVVRLLPHERRAYAESLVEVNEQASAHALPLPVMGARTGSVRAFQRRLTKIMSDHSPTKRSAWMWPAVGVVLLLALPGFSWENKEAPTAHSPSAKQDEVVESANTGVAPANPPEETRHDNVNVVRIAESASASVAVIRFRPEASPESQHQGLGVVLSKRGLIVTCQRLLPSPGDITVKLRNGKTFTPTETVRTIGPFAVLKIDADPNALSPIRIRHPAELRPGTSVLAIGAGEGSELIVTRGIVSAMDRDAALAPGLEFESLIQTDIATPSFFSGGPLVDSHGLLLGINPLGPSDARGPRNQGIAFFAPLVEIVEAFPDAVQLPRRVSASEATDPTERTDNEVFRKAKIGKEVIDEILLRVEGHYFQEVDKQELLDAAIDGMLRKLGEDSAYLRQEELEDLYETIDQSIVGVGIEMRHQNGELVVVRTLPSSPAAKAGIRNGDVIEQIDRVAVTDLVEKKRLAVVAGLIRGKLGEAVTLGVRRKNTGKRESIRIVRSPIEIDTVRGHHRAPGGKWQFTLDEENKIGYIRITAFAKTTSRDVGAAVGDLRSRGMQRLVLDLRDCPGGLLTAAVETADLFVDEGTIVTTTSRTDADEVFHYKAHKPNTHVGFPMVVLVNGRTALAAEIVAACLQDHERSTIAGERTFGRGVVYGIFPLKSGGGAVRLATASFLRPNGKRIHRFAGADDSDDWGVTPDQGLEIILPDLPGDRKPPETSR